MREMGGDYWLDEQSVESMMKKIPSRFCVGEDSRLVYSGRTALDFAIEDIKFSRNIKSAYLPSYCCRSMVQPFIDQGISVEFYDVNFNGKMEVNIDKQNKCDIFLFISYFGYQNEKLESIVNYFKQCNAIIIEDCTHNIFSENKKLPQVDYLVCSLRKWLHIATGGYISKMKGELIKLQFNQPDMYGIIDIFHLMSNKYQYLRKAPGIEKSDFLGGIKSFQHNFYNAYKQLNMDYISLAILQNSDYDEMCTTRQSNALIIHSRIKRWERVESMFDVEMVKCPLYVPILLENEVVRNNLQNYLATKDIYCPIHWQYISGDIYEQGKSNIYKRELSLVCDYRYKDEDINKMLDCIEVFFNEVK